MGGAAWVGDGPGNPDPLKEAKAARERVRVTISTLAQESILHDGGDWTAKQRQRAREESLRIESLGADRAGQYVSRDHHLKAQN